MYKAHAYQKLIALDLCLQNLTYQTLLLKLSPHVERRDSSACRSFPIFDVLLFRSMDCFIFTVESTTFAAEEKEFNDFFSHFVCISDLGIGCISDAIGFRDLSLIVAVTSLFVSSLADA